VAALSLVAFLDEVSFGERAFHISMPFIGSQKIDAVHDLFKLCFNVTLHILRWTPTPILVIGTMVSGCLLLEIAHKNKSRLLEMARNLSRAEPYFFLRVAILLLTISTFIDFDIVRYEVVFTLEELFEMNAALALVFCGINVLYTSSSKRFTRPIVTTPEIQAAPKVVMLAPDEESIAMDTDIQTTINTAKQ
jgi:hypothetical protein